MDYKLEGIKKVPLSYDFRVPENDVPLSVQDQSLSYEPDSINLAGKNKNRLLR
ncbi:MAG: hypothetical protein KZQ70_02135 [gamma proteobacterium symbiont of Lucinoma myriamae]|nr:hypothetical protein [gamma proteobacterium symbiont of Lucinoma myriamae]MCU7820017.1 hypothetical protein [gamma proteobacterium symbiont of Lucinoma myriamae]MCU7831382.1 hypothetical protein [gamma proteobacterium symbiont of Lucinoma myriamae]